eukprot:s240_g24.t1
MLIAGCNGHATARRLECDTQVLPSCPITCRWLTRICGTQHPHALHFSAPMCTPSTDVSAMRPEHQCLVLRQIAMQYVRARDAGQFAPAEFCTLLTEVIRTHQMALLWSSPLLSLLCQKCVICGHEASDQELSAHLTTEHSLALNSAMMLHANLAAMMFGFFQCCASQLTCPICAATCAEVTVQQHLEICPILHQLAWLLSNPCHGRHGGRNGGISGPSWAMSSVKRDRSWTKPPRRSWP